MPFPADIIFISNLAAGVAGADATTWLKTRGRCPRNKGCVRRGLIPRTSPGKQLENSLTIASLFQVFITTVYLPLIFKVETNDYIIVYSCRYYVFDFTRAVYTFV